MKKSTHSLFLPLSAVVLAAWFNQHFIFCGKCPIAVVYIKVAAGVRLWAIPHSTNAHVRSACAIWARASIHIVKVNSRTWMTNYNTSYYQLSLWFCSSKSNTEHFWGHFQPSRSVSHTKVKLMPVLCDFSRRLLMWYRFESLTCILYY